MVFLLWCEWLSMHFILTCYSKDRQTDSIVAIMIMHPVPEKLLHSVGGRCCLWIILDIDICVTLVGPDSFELYQLLGLSVI